MSTQNKYRIVKKTYTNGSVFFFVQFAKECRLNNCYHENIFPFLALENAKKAAEETTRRLDDYSSSIDTLDKTEIVFSND